MERNALRRLEALADGWPELQHAVVWPLDEIPLQFPDEKLAEEARKAAVSAISPSVPIDVIVRGNYGLPLHLGASDVPNVEVGPHNPFCFYFAPKSDSGNTGSYLGAHDQFCALVGEWEHPQSDRMFKREMTIVVAPGAKATGGTGPGGWDEWNWLHWVYSRPQTRQVDVTVRGRNRQQDRRYGVKYQPGGLFAGCLLALDDAKTPNLVVEASEPLRPLQRAILKVLDGKAMKVQSLANAVCGGDHTRLYKQDDLRELRDAGRVVHKRGVGYYRPDCPPAE